MGTRSRNYIAIQPGHAAPPPKDLIDRLCAHVTQDARGTLLVFDTNFAPLWSRFTGQGTKLADLDEERALLAWLGTVPPQAFRFVRVGEITDTAGEWNAVAFHADAVVRELEAELRSELGPEYSAIKIPPASEDERQRQMLGNSAASVRAAADAAGGPEAFVRASLRKLLAGLDDLPGGDVDDACEALRQLANRIKMTIAERLAARPAPALDAEGGRVIFSITRSAFNLGPIYLAPMSCLSDVQELLELVRTSDEKREVFLASARRGVTTAMALVDAWLGEPTPA